MNEEKIRLCQSCQSCIDALAADVADMLAQESGMEITDALREFMKTKTYSLLFDERSLLYLESAEYVLARIFHTVSYRGRASGRGYKARDVRATQTY